MRPRCRLMSRRATTGAVLALGLALVVPAAARADTASVGTWHLDAVTAGTTPDASGVGNTGTDVAGAVTTGRFGDGLQLSAAGHGFLVGAREDLLRPTSVSTLAWVRRSGTPGPFRTIVGKGALGCSDSAYAIYTGSSGGLQAYVTLDVAGTRSSASTTQLPAAQVWDGQWHAVGMTFDEVTRRLTLYLDGQPVSEVPAPSGSIDHFRYTGEKRLGVGRYPDGGCSLPGFQYTGTLDEVRVYPRALTAVEMAWLQNSPGPEPRVLPAPSTDPPVTPTPTPEPTPPAPPVVTPDPPARNVTPPEIESTTQRDGRFRYSCSNGTWEGLAADPKFVRKIYEYEGGLLSGKPSVAKLVTGKSAIILSATSPIRRFFCIVTATTRSGATIGASGPTRIVPQSAPLTSTRVPIVENQRIVGDMRIRGIDVFQIVQPSSGAKQYAFDGFPQRDLGFPTLCGGGTPTALVLPGCAANGDATQQARYQGVMLDADKPTSAVVYLDRAPDALPAHIDAQLQVRLRMTAGPRVNAALTQSVRAINVESSPSDAVTEAERGDERFGVRFDIPAAWIAAAANGTFDLQATVTVVDASNVVQCDQGRAVVLTAATGGCSTNDTFKVTDVPARFLPFSGIIRTIGVTTPSQTLTSLRTPESAFASARTLLPAGEHFQISPYVAQVQIDPVTATNATNCPVPEGGETATATPARLRRCASANVTNAIRAWVASGPARTVEASPTDGFHVLAALHNYQFTAGVTEPGSSFNGDGVGKWGRSNNQPYMELNDGSVNRLMTSATHELVHTLGAPHAGKNLGGLVGDLSCGGDANGQVGEPWPGDQAGRLQGVKFDPATGARTVDSDTVVANVSQPLWDFMSYCTGDPTAWLSPRNWNRAFAFMIEAESVVPTTFQVPIRRSAKVAQAPGTVPTVFGAGFVVGTVVDGRARITGLEPADAEHVVPAGDPGSGLRVRGLGAAGQTIGEAGARVETSTDSGATTFIAPVPKGSAAVELVSGGEVVDRRAQGRPPTVKILAPSKAGTRVRGALKVRYRAGDPDGGPLTASIEFSPDGRSKWRTVLRGAASGTATLSPGLLKAGTKARIRVKVSDGFATATATSPALRIDGRPPTARIVLPGPRDRGTAAAKVVLLGQAADENGRRLRGRALTWFAGRERLGTGERVRVRLPGGRTTLRLVARDTLGRETTVKRTTRVDPVALELRTLRAARVKPKARRVVVTVATNVPAVLRLGGVAVKVGPKARRVTLPLPARPAVGILRLQPRLTPAAGGPALRPGLTVFRG